MDPMGTILDHFLRVFWVVFFFPSGCDEPGKNNRGLGWEILVDDGWYDFAYFSHHLVETPKKDSWKKELLRLKLL